MMNTKYFMLRTFIFFLTVTACKEDDGFLTAEGTDVEGNTMTRKSLRVLEILSVTTLPEKLVLID